MGKNEKINSSLSKWVNISFFVSHLLTFLHLREIKSVQGKLICKEKTKKAMRET